MANPTAYGYYSHEKYPLEEHSGAIPQPMAIIHMKSIHWRNTVVQSHSLWLLFTWKVSTGGTLWCGCNSYCRCILCRFYKCEIRFVSFLHPVFRSNLLKSKYSRLSLSRPRLSRITAYLEVKILFLLKHENLTTGKKYCGKLFHNIFNISLTSRVQLHIYLLNVVVRIIFSSILQIWYVEVRISRSISDSPLEFDITRVDCTSEPAFWICSRCINHHSDVTYLILFTK